MRDIICVGGSTTSYRRPDKKRFNGECPKFGEPDAGTGSYPEAINRLYGNKIYNLGVVSNTMETSVLSAISKAKELINNGNTNFSIIYNPSDLLRHSIYFSDKMRKVKGIKDNLNNPVNNNYLFNNDQSGFMLMGGLQNVSEGQFDCKNAAKIAKSYSEYLFSIESSEIKSLSYLLLLQNFCKANNIRYKIFFDFDIFSNDSNDYFELDKTNTETYFKSFFIDKKLCEYEPLNYIKNNDAYVYDIFKMLDLNSIWFYEIDNLKYGGFCEWLYKNNEYKENDYSYRPLYIEDISRATHTLDDTSYLFPIERIKEQIKNNEFMERGHPTYYYWEKFVKEVMITWNLF